MANREQFAILKRGGAAWNAWRQENPSIESNLLGANWHARNTQFMLQFQTYGAPMDCSRPLEESDLFDR